MYQLGEKFVEELHARGLDEAAVCVSWEGLGKEIRKVVGGFYLLDFEFLGCDQFLCKREDLRVDVFRVVSLDEPCSNLSHTSGVIFIDDDRWWLVG